MGYNNDCDAIDCLACSGTGMAPETEDNKQDKETEGRGVTVNLKTESL